MSNLKNIDHKVDLAIEELHIILSQIDNMSDFMTKRCLSYILGILDGTIV